MPWTAEWYDDDERVLSIFPVDPWNWEEFKAFADNMRAMAESKPYKVHLLFRLEGGLTMPKPSSEAGEWVAPWMPIRNEVLNEPQNRGLAIVVAAPLFMESIMEMVKSQVKGQMTTDHIRFVKSLQEAERIIADLDD